MKHLRKILCAWSCLAVLCLSGCAATGYSEFNAYAFSDDILISARIMGGRASYAFEQMQKVVAEIDAQVSLTDANSDLSKFNAAATGERVEVGAHCYNIIKLAEQYYTLTDGAFNPALAPLSRLWHVDAHSLADISGEKTLPTESEVKELLSACDPSVVSASEDGGKYYLIKSADVELDFGGIAKGYAADECVRILGAYNISSALIDISGNSYFYGDYVSNGKSDKWHVGVVSPRPRRGSERNYVCALNVEGGNSVVTSGDYMRYYERDGVYIPHIIGRDGVPIGVTNDGNSWVNSGEHVISATVIGGSSALCDALSTAVAVLGIKDGSVLLKKSGCKGLIFTEKRYTIIGSELYRPDKYDGYGSYEYYEP